jgi:hypothetical protein
MKEPDDSKGGLPAIVLALLMSGAYHCAELSAERVLPAEEVWVYGTCFDYQDNLLHCRPDDDSPGAGLTVGSGQVVWSSACFGECEPLEEPVSHQTAPHDLDTWAGFAAALAVLFGAAALDRRLRGRAEERDELDDPSAEGPR